MPEVQIHVDGLDLVERNLRAVIRETPTALAQIQMETAAPIVAAARRRARKKTGRMASTIRVAPAEPVTAIREADWVIAGEGTEYTAVQHHGWPGHGIEPNPFLDEAVADEGGRALADYERRIGVFLERVWIDS